MLMREKGQTPCTVPAAVIKLIAQRIKLKGTKKNNTVTV